MSDGGPGAANPRYLSVVHALEYHSASDAGASVTVEARPNHAVEMTHGALLDAARRCAATLAQRGVAAGDRVMLTMTTSAQAVVALTGLLVLGAIPVPIAPPAGARRAASSGHVTELLTYLEPRAVIADGSLRAELGPPQIVHIDLDALYDRSTNPAQAMRPIRYPAADDCALIQCTSGSTGGPKGVVISHRNLAANIEQIAEVAGWTARDVWTGWLPLYHDMGLVGGLLTSLYLGSTTVLMPPARFLRAPADWLSLVHRYRGTIGASTNFGLGYTASRAGDEQLDGLDLSCLRMIFCGAEQISRSTVTKFVDRLGDRGLSADVVNPCYGLAEATLIVTSAGRRAPLSCDTVSRRELAHSAVAADTDPSAPDALEIVEVGEPVSGTQVRVVGRDGNTLPDSHIGSVQFRGPSRTVGYYRLPAESAMHMGAEGWWNTGDIGYLRDGSLRITGRESELIVIRGANYSPVDFEHLAQSVEEVRPGGVAAVGNRDTGSDTDTLCLIVEIETATPAADLAARIRSAVTSQTGVAVAQIRFVPRRAIPKTTSGKMKRALAQRIFFCCDATND